MGNLIPLYWAWSTDIVVKTVLRHKTQVYLALVVRPQDNSGPTAAVL
jgi:hypothetical protein